MLGVSKCDTVDSETIENLRKYFAEHPIDNPEAPETTDEWGNHTATVQVCFFSSVAHQGLDELKDALWAELIKECNQVIDISHAPIDVVHIDRDEPEVEDDEPHTIYMNEVDEEWDLDKYKGIGWDQ